VAQTLAGYRKQRRKAIHGTQLLRHFWILSEEGLGRPGAAAC